MRFGAICVLAFLAGCTGGAENPVSKPTDPVVDLTGQPPDVTEAWPCPPFVDGTTQDRLGDSDGDGLTDCQEDHIGSDANSADSDGDGVPDAKEKGVLTYDPV